MGLGKNWTKEELDLLEEEWGKTSIPAIAKKLERSVEAIKLKAGRLGLGSFLESSEFVSLNVLLKTFGIVGGYTEHVKKLKRHGFKIHKKKVNNNSFRMVDIEEFWVFAEKNRHLFDFSKLEENALGMEPQWVKNKRKEDERRALAVKPNETKWTASEDSLLVSLLRAYRYTYPEIAERLKRTEGAIQRRVLDLGIKERPLKADTHDLWTEEQHQTLAEMIKAGSNYENMSRKIGKSAKAIRGKVYNMYLTENLGKVIKIMGDGQWGDNRPERTISKRRLMTTEEKQEVKEQMSRLAGLFAYRVRQCFENQDNWQRNLCQHWDEVKGCTAGGLNCDECGDFLRVQPQCCVRCGATFYERKPNQICERCRKQRKKSAARKYMQMQNIQTRRTNNAI